MNTVYITAYIRKMQERCDREYMEYRKHVTDPERLHCVDEAHHRFLCDFANDVWEAFDRQQRKDIVRLMKRRQFSTDDITEVTGLSSTEIEQLD
jgi:arylsulfatase A-like enzyme